MPLDGDDRHVTVEMPRSLNWGNENEFVGEAKQHQDRFASSLADDIRCV